MKSVNKGLTLTGLEAPPMPKGHAKHIKNVVGCNNCHRDTGHKNGLMVDESFE